MLEEEGCEHRFSVDDKAPSNKADMKTGIVDCSLVCKIKICKLHLEPWGEQLELEAAALPF